MIRPTLNRRATRVELPPIREGEKLVITHVCGTKLDEPIVLHTWDSLFVTDHGANVIEITHG